MLPSVRDALSHLAFNRLGPVLDTVPVRSLRRRLAVAATADDVLRVLDALHETEVPAWLVGGWGVSALLGRQNRRHVDVDVAVEHGARTAALAALATIGYEPYDDGVCGGVWMPARTILRDAEGRHLELLAVSEREQAAYPPGWLVDGKVGGRTVPCASAALQLRLHKGYRPRPEDRRDVAALVALDHVTPPPGYTHDTRQPGPVLTALRRRWRRVRRRIGGRPAESVLFVPVPQATEALGDVPGFAPTFGGPDLPPHVTLLYPFVPADEVDDATIAAVADMVAGLDPFPFTLTNVDRFADATYLVPEPKWAFVDITQRLWARWPDHPPYRGDFASEVPHVTVAGTDLLPRSVDEIERRLPIDGVVQEIVLAVERNGGWEERARFRLAGTGPSDEQPRH